MLVSPRLLLLSVINGRREPYRFKIREKYFWINNKLQAMLNNIGKQLSVKREEKSRPLCNHGDLADFIPALFWYVVIILSSIYQ